MITTSPLDEFMRFWNGKKRDDPRLPNFGRRGKEITSLFNYHSDERGEGERMNTKSYGNKHFKQIKRGNYLNNEGARNSSGPRFLMKDVLPANGIQQQLQRPF